MDCQCENIILQYIYGSLYDFTIELSFEEVLEITSMFGSLEGDIEGLQSKCLKMIEFYNFEEKDKWTFLISASMLNFGKLSVPSSILNKKDSLSFDEYEILKSNIYHNKNALKSIYGFDDISKWATRHQEQLDGNGYPFKISANHLSLKDRLMAVLNIYNALVNKKFYREAYSHKKAMEILKLKDKNYQLDKTIINDLEIIINK